MEISLPGDVNVPDSLSRSGQNCADEPIRVPGSVQRHGFLLLLDDHGEHVVGASQNAEEFLEVPLGLILGTPLETILEREVLGSLSAILHSGRTKGSLLIWARFKCAGGSSAS